jgi:glycosyltransferase involved in cell wall biosynthesis
MPTLNRVPRRLNVLFIMPPCLPTPPSGYGGIEAVAASLLPELERQGARITLTTPIGSTVEVSERHELTEPLYPILSHPYNEVAPRVEEYVMKVMELMWKRNFDIIHDFSGMTSVLNTIVSPLPSGAVPPIIHTIHGPIEPYRNLYVGLLKYPNLSYTAISQAQLADGPSVLWPRTRVIYNGLSPDDYPVGPGGGRLLVMGRICHDKGQDRLIEYCSANGLDLDVAGTVAELSTVEQIDAELAKGPASKSAHKADFQLFAGIRHLIDGQRIKFYGNVGGQLKHNLLGGAGALVVPNRWSEPFGMVAIEAMASGTPVVAMATGAMPELIKHGVTGYLANSFEELGQYLRPEAIAKLDRDECRRHVVENFSMRAVAGEYLDLYRKLVQPQLQTKAVPQRRTSPRRTMAVMYEQLPTRSKRPQA